MAGLTLTGLALEAQKGKTRTDATEDDDISDPEDEADWWSGDSNKDEDEPSVATPDWPPESDPEMFVEAASPSTPPPPPELVRKESSVPDVSVLSAVDIDRDSDNPSPPLPSASPPPGALRMHLQVDVGEDNAESRSSTPAPTPPALVRPLEWEEGGGGGVGVGVGGGGAKGGGGGGGGAGGREGGGGLSTLPSEEEGESSSAISEHQPSLSPEQPGPSERGPREGAEPTASPRVALPPLHDVSRRDSGFLTAREWQAEEPSHHDQRASLQPLPPSQREPAILSTGEVPVSIVAVESGATAPPRPVMDRTSASCRCSVS